MKWLTGLAAGASVAGAISIAPLVTTALVAVGIMLVRAGHTAVDRRRRLVQRRGVRGLDGVMAFASFPFTTVLALPVAALACTVALTAAMALSGLAALFGGGAGASTVVGGGTFVALLWWGPAHPTLRRAGLAVSRAALTPSAAGAVTVLLFTATAIVLLVVAANSATAWFPLPEPPSRWLGRVL